MINPKITTLQNDLFATLKDALADAKDLVDGLQGELVEVSQLAAACFTKATLGDPTAADVLNVLSARAKVLSATVLGRGQTQAGVTFQRVLDVLGKFLAAFVKAAI